MLRREFITLLSGATMVSPLNVAAQTLKVPVVGFLHSGSPNEFAQFADAFQRGLSEAGFVAGKNVVIEYRWAENRNERLRELAADLANRGSALIAATGGIQPVLAAKAVTTTIPILFAVGVNPVEAGLVSSFNRPGGNVTGVSIYSLDLIPKRLELLNWLVPGITTIALLVNPASPAANRAISEMEMATSVTRQQLLVLKVRDEIEFDVVLADALRQGVGGMITGAEPYLTDRRSNIVALAKKYNLPAMYPWREYVQAGGLTSYGPRLSVAYHDLGGYASRILKGAKVSDLPVQLLPRVELALNLTAAKILGLTIPRQFLAGVVEFIE